MTPKVLFKLHVTVNDYQNGSAVPSGKRWVIKHIYCCPTSTNSCIASIQTSDAYQLINQGNLSVGETLDIGSIVLDATEYLKFKDEQDTYDVIAVGYEETV